MRLKCCLTQVNPTVGDIKGNAEKIIKHIQNAEKNNIRLIVFPELAVTGYPPEDLVLKKGFIRDNISIMKKTAKAAVNITAVAGFVNERKGKIFNSAAVMNGGKIKAVYDKICLPNYGVFDEKRYFTPGRKPLIVKISGTRAGITICEDMWENNTVLNSMKNKIDLLINLSASPYHTGKHGERKKIFKAKAKYYDVPALYVNLTGGQDEVVFDGRSFVAAAGGAIMAEAGSFTEEELYAEIEGKQVRTEKKEKNRLNSAAEIYDALVMGTRDYIHKNGFTKAVIALSGGVDSALVAVIAADAIGSRNTGLIYMPSKFSSKASGNDARKLAGNLNIKLKVIDIQKAADLYGNILSPFFKGTKRGIAEENLQARIRGNIVMAFSNKFGSLVLAAGNKSEMSTGYATLYGDMAGGLAVIKDVPKTMVYELCLERNRKAGYDLIPKSIIKKAPAAELKPNQKDTDTLPPYPVLDRIIEDYVEKDKTYNELRKKYNENVLKKTIGMIDRNEYKRRQAPPGIKVTSKAFGRDRRMPITNKYRE